MYIFWRGSCATVNVKRILELCDLTGTSMRSETYYLYKSNDCFFVNPYSGKGTLHQYCFNASNIGNLRVSDSMNIPTTVAKCFRTIPLFPMS